MTDSVRGISFIIIRAIVYFALLLISYLLDTAIQQISEAEEAKIKAGELERKTTFYHRMAHDLLTPLTIVSTNVQTAQSRPHEADELLTHSQEEIMRMAEMINNALEEGE